MKDKQFACVIVVFAIIACFFGIMKMQSKLQDARKRATSAKATAENIERQRLNAINAHQKLQEESKNEIAYYDLWKPYFKHTSPPDVSEQMNYMVTNAKITPFKFRANPYGHKDKYGVINKVQRVTFELVDGYAKLFNWLGNLENDIATSRITSLRVTKATGDAEIKMEVTIDVPIFPNSGKTVDQPS